MDQIITDPTGFEVTISDACWDAHVVVRHPEMAEHKGLVAETIAAPEAIYRGKRDPSRRIYRRRYETVPGVGNFLDVLVFVGDSDGFMATTYFTAGSIRTLGERLWPSE